MDYAVMLVTTTVGGLILYAVISALSVTPGRNLQRKFVALGVIRGRTKDEIVASVGPPQSVSYTGENKELLQWMATGYHICLIFEGGVCQGVQSETVV
jgi:hypothetical protein